MTWLRGLILGACLLVGVAVVIIGSSGDAGQTCDQNWCVNRTTGQTCNVVAAADRGPYPLPPGSCP